MTRYAATPTRGGAALRTTMTIDVPHAGPTLSAIAVRLEGQAGGLPALERQALVLEALAAALAAAGDGVPAAWTVRASSDDLLYHVTPLPGHAVSLAAAQEMAGVLRGQPRIAWAAPELG